MTAEGQELVVRQYGDKLAEVMGGGDVMAMVTQVETNVRAITDIARKRGFITKFTQENKKTGEIKETEFYGLPAWQILGLVYGVTPVVEWVHAIDGGYHARAIAQTRDGNMVGAAEGFCHRKEPGRQYKSDHDLAAQAQARAERNALRSALGAILVLAGYDVPDPDAPATNGQVGMLHQLERDLGWSHDVGHATAGVDSYKELTRQQAGDLIDEWSAERDKGSAPAPASGRPDNEGAPEAAGEAADGASSLTPIITSRSGYAGGDPVTTAQLNKMSVLAAKLGWDEAERHRQAECDSWKDLSKREASHLIDEWQKAAEGSDGAAANATGPGPSAEPPNPEREALLDHALSLYPNEKALLNTARSVDANVKTLADIDTDTLHDLIQRRSP